MDADPESEESEDSEDLVMGPIQSLTAQQIAWLHDTDATLLVRSPLQSGH